MSLTIPWDSKSNFKAAFDRKTARYSQLAMDLEDRGWIVSNLPIEIGTRGSVDKRNATNIETIANLCGIRAIQRLKGSLCKIALLGSYRIYLARNSQCWNPGGLIEVGAQGEEGFVSLQPIGLHDQTFSTFLFSIFLPFYFKCFSNVQPIFDEILMIFPVISYLSDI